MVKKNNLTVSILFPTSKGILSSCRSERMVINLEQYNEEYNKIEKVTYFEHYSDMFEYTDDKENLRRNERYPRDAFYDISD